MGGLGWWNGTRWKIPWYTHRLMHRKRVTSELHDSYFRLSTIKQDIPNIEWAIVWVIEARQLESKEVADKMQWRKPSSSRELGPWASGWAALEDEKDTTLTAIRVGVNILQLCSVSNPLSHAKFTNKVRGIFLKKSSHVLYHCVVVILSAWICIWLDNIKTFRRDNRIN